ncbi:hypothetical protein [Candidatus Laterigemmans baculatus]|uniref:hypothetical protein n=1 Tax=Candidatus Laterigemmans baculatus TaxID=2770505 RepID=UPI0013DB8E35|nr:hypothetical protein [Candidatus Laterigemmans baculatus]
MPAASPTLGPTLAIAFDRAMEFVPAAALEPNSFRSQMMLLGGFVLLAWVLIRRSIRAKKRERAAAAEWQRHQQQTAAATDSQLPLANAPVEVLRWQGAMFDLQRELKAELETKISVLQAMVQLADQRIATLERLQASAQRAETEQPHGSPAGQAGKPDVR